MRMSFTAPAAAMLALCCAVACKSQDRGYAKGPETGTEASEAVLEQSQNSTVVTRAMVDPCDANVVFFAPGTTQLDENGKARITTLAQCIRSGETAELVVVEEGEQEVEEEVGRELSRQRARTVAMALREMGIDDGAIIIRDGDAGRVGQKLWPEEGVAAAE